MSLKCECGECRTCYQREYMRRWRADHPEEAAAQNREAAKRGRQRLRLRDPERYFSARRRAARSYRQRNPEKARARDAVHNALRDGRLERGSCEMCGAVPAEAHHDDYSKPLDVRWLCAEHHTVETWYLRANTCSATLELDQDLDPEEGTAHGSRIT